MKEKAAGAAFSHLETERFMSKISDKEVYPAMWVALFCAAGAYLLWRYGLGAPTISSCWIWKHLHLYCPGCGGTRALIALFHGRFLRALWYHPAFALGVVWWIVYMVSQTIWRLRGHKGWVLRYSDRWLIGLVLVAGINCVVRNLLLVTLGIGM